MPFIRPCRAGGAGASGHDDGNRQKPESKLHGGPWMNGDVSGRTRTGGDLWNASTFLERMYEY
jgi:hypothetical protein